MKMPFERLMERVAALSPAEWELPLGTLAARWGEPASRIGDAIDALKVLRGERTYISLTAPAPEPPELCRGFRWVGQSFASCDRCGRPAWEHQGEERVREGATVLLGDDAFEVRPWKPGEAEAIRAKWGAP